MKMNKEKLSKQIETMNKEQLIELCKSTTSIVDDLQDRIDKGIQGIDELLETLKQLSGFQPIRVLEDIKKDLRGKDNE